MNRCEEARIIQEGKGDKEAIRRRLLAYWRSEEGRKAIEAAPAWNRHLTPEEIVEERMKEVADHEFYEAAAERARKDGDPGTSPGRGKLDERGA